jgi:hypothetical protein
MGYKKIYFPSHPYAMADGCVYEHRWIMEGLIGRYLSPEEQVHHKDEDKSNNDPTNLIHCPTQKDHSKEHAYDDDYLIELLIRYADVVGYLPSKRLCDEHPEMPNSSTYVRHFESWSNAKKLAQHRIEAMNYEEAI